LYSKFEENWPDDIKKKFAKIPLKILLCIGISEQDKLRVEKIFDEVLLPLKSNAKDRTKRLLFIYASFDDTAKAAFKRLLQDKAK
jgi:hypothetical protein